jgi:hypothetical protein
VLERSREGEGEGEGDRAEEPRRLAAVPTLALAVARIGPACRSRDVRDGTPFAAGG